MLPVHQGTFKAYARYITGVFLKVHSRHMQGIFGIPSILPVHQGVLQVYFSVYSSICKVDSKGIL